MIISPGGRLGIKRAVSGDAFFVQGAELTVKVFIDRQCNVEVFMQEVNRLLYCQEGVSFAAAGAAEIGNGEQAVGGCQIAQLPFTDGEWISSGNEADEDTGTDCGSAIAVEAAKATQYITGSLTGESYFLFFLSGLVGDVVICGKQNSGNKEMVLGAVHGYLRVSHQADCHFKGVCGFTVDAIAVDKGVCRRTVALVTDKVSVGAFHVGLVCFTTKVTV